MVELNTPIQKGQIVLSGALAPMVDLKPGAEVQFNFNGLDSIVLASE